MSYGVVRVQKFTAGSVKGIEIHDRREKDKSHTNPDIDFEKSKLNYDIHHAQNENFRQAANDRISQLNLTKAVRKDAIVVAQVLVTSDAAFFSGLSRERQEQFFKDSYNFLADRYGKENVISSTIHLDEKTPHMHFNFVPVTSDGRLSAKSIFTKASLIEQQTAFFNQVGASYGLLRGETKEQANESGKRRNHLETAEYKKAMAMEKEAIGAAEKAAAELRSIENALELQRSKETELQDKINSLYTVFNAHSSDLQDIMDDLKNTISDLHGELQDTLQKATEASVELRETHDSINILKAEENVLQGKLEGLQGKIKGYQNHLAEAEAYGRKLAKEIDLAEKAFKTSIANKAAALGGIDEVKRLISQERQKEAREAKYSIFERFLEAYPQVKAIFDQFIQLATGDKVQNHSRDSYHPSR